MTKLILILCFALSACNPRAGERDKNGEESGYTPVTYFDPVTGCEYLSTGQLNALIPRIAADGKTHKGCKEVQNG